MKRRVTICLLGVLAVLSFVKIDHLGAHQELLELKIRAAGEQYREGSLSKTEVIYYTGFEPGDPLGTNVDYNGGTSPDEWHLTTEMLYQGTTTWMTAPVGSYFCHIGNDSSGYSDGNEVGYQIHMDLSDYSDAYFSYLSAMQAYQDPKTFDFDRFVVWGQHEGMGVTWINLDPGEGYAWGGDWGTYWYLPEGDSISLEDLVGHPDVIIEFWFQANCGSPEGFGVAIDEIIVTGTPIPTAVTVSSFEAIPGPDHIVLKWTTESEKDNLGFHLLRRTDCEDHFVRLNQELIPSAGEGSSEYPLQYRFMDRSVENGIRYEYRLESINYQGKRDNHGHVSATTLIPNSTPEEFRLSQNYPNPFNPSTEIRYQLPEDGYVNLRIYNIAGQAVRTLVDSDWPASVYTVTWDGRDDRGQQVSSGIYFCLLRCGEFGQTKKMVLMR